MEVFTKQMLDLAAKGDQYAIEDLYKLTYSSVYKTAKVLIQDEDAVLDIVQDSYIKAFQSLDQLDSPENFRAWIKRIAANKAKDYLKKKRPVLFSEMAGEDGEEMNFRDECPQHDPEQVMDRKETVRLMREILDSLSEEQRLVIGMFYYEQMSVKEIAEILGCSENTVKSRLNYGRKKVESKVRDLEKKGTRLYSLAPLPFLLYLFSLEAAAAEVPSVLVMEGVVAQCAATGAAAAAGTAGTAAASGAKTAAGIGAKAAAGAKSAMAAKVTAGVLAVAVAGGAAAVLQDNGTTREQLLDSYRQVCSAPEKEYRRMFADAPLLKYDLVASYRQNSSLADYYNVSELNIVSCDYDLDGNGTEELLLAYYDPRTEEVQLQCVYTFDEDNAVLAMSEEHVGQTDQVAQLRLTQDNKVVQMYAMEDSMYDDLWAIGEDGYTMEKVQSYRYDFQEDTFYTDGRTVSSEEYHRRTDSDKIRTLPWEPLAVCPDPKYAVTENARDAVSCPLKTLSPQEIQMVTEQIPWDIYAVLQILPEDYDAFPSGYEVQFPRLQGGIMDALVHRGEQQAWIAWGDVDGDGQEELCVGLGTGPDAVSVLAVYRRNADVLTGAAAAEYVRGSAELTWKYPGE